VEPRPTLYLDTSIVSFLTARPSRDIYVLARQQCTHQWWERERDNYRLFASPVVVGEARRGDPTAAAKRLERLRGIPILPLVPEMEALAAALYEALHLPQAAKNDALHLACAVHYEMDYLLTWNLVHLASGPARRLLAEYARQHLIWMPIICTPDEMVQDEVEDQ
jgi:predicted nucleic acid-binding protein